MGFKPYNIISVREKQVKVISGNFHRSECPDFLFLIKNTPFLQQVST